MFTQIYEAVDCSAWIPKCLFIRMYEIVVFVCTATFVVDIICSFSSAVLLLVLFFILFVPVTVNS